MLPLHSHSSQSQQELRLLGRSENQILNILYLEIQNHAHFQFEFSLVQFQQQDVCRLRRIVLNIFFQKLDFANNVQLSLTLAALSLGLWWTFDRSRSGLGLGITIAFVATLITQFLVYNGVYQ